MVINMEEKKISSLNYLTIFLISHSFYTIQVLTQHLFYMYSKHSVPIICLFYTLLPLLTFFVCKLINNNKLKINTKNNFIFSFLTSLYLILTSVISITTLTNIILIYYYQQTSIIILLIFLILPIVYTILKGENNFFALSSVLLIIFLLFKYAYLNNSSHIDYYPFYNILNINKSNLTPLIIISLPIVLEPIILINNQKDISSKINIKLITIFSTLLSLVGILTILRQTWEFGDLLNKIRFPYLESVKNLVAGKFFENIDYYYLLSMSVSVYIRLGYTLIAIKKSFKLNTLKTFIVLSLILLLIYVFQSNMAFYNFALKKVLLITSTCLILLLLLIPFIIKRRKKTNG